MAKWLGFYQREFGDGQLSDIVSHTVPVVNALRKYSTVIADKAESNLMVHRDTGESSIKTLHYPQTDLDSYVYLHDTDNRSADDKKNGKRSAAGIEKQFHILSDAVDRAIFQGRTSL